LFNFDLKTSFQKTKTSIKGAFELIFTFF